MMCEILANADIRLPPYEVKLVLFKWVFSYVKVLPYRCQWMSQVYTIIEKSHGASKLSIVKVKSFKENLSYYHIRANTTTALYWEFRTVWLCTMINLYEILFKNNSIFEWFFIKTDHLHPKSVFWRSNREWHSICADTVFYENFY